MPGTLTGPEIVPFHSHIYMSRQAGLLRALSISGKHIKAQHSTAPAAPDRPQFSLHSCPHFVHYTLSAYLCGSISACVACTYLEICCHGLISTSNLPLEVIRFGIVAFGVVALDFDLVGSLPHVLLADDVLDFLCLDLAVLKIAVIDEELVWTRPAGECIAATGEIVCRIRLLDDQHVVAVGAD